MMAFSWSYGGGGSRIYVGPGSIGDMKLHLRGARRVAIVTGRAAARASGALADVEALLEGMGVERMVMEGVPPNPPSGKVEELAASISSFGADAVIAVGGGSAIDSAKVASAVASNGGGPMDYIYGRRRAERCIPVLAVNLTHGTGSEANRYANLTDSETGDKVGGEVCYPAASFDEPRYTLTMPAEEVLCTSFDALYHAYESSTTAGSPPLAQALAEEAVRAIAVHLPGAVSRPSDVEHRYWLMYSAMLSGVAIDISPTNVIHAVENFLSGLRPSLPHGCGLAIVGPLMAPIVHSSSPGPSSRILRALGVPLDGSPESAGRALSSFQASVGFSRSLGEYGIDADLLREAVRRAFSNPISAERLRGRLAGANLDERSILNLLSAAL